MTAGCHDLDGNSVEDIQLQPFLPFENLAVEDVGVFLMFLQDQAKVNVLLLVKVKQSHLYNMDQLIFVP